MGEISAAVTEFHQLFYNSGAWVSDTKWMGISVQKCPFDLWVYQEIMHSLRPDLIIETGTCYGGSALFLAQMCDLLGTGRVVTVDVQERPNRPQHGRITYLTGSSIELPILGRLTELVEGVATVMVILDSDHSRNHVFQELKHYAPFVTPKSYMIVEDTDVNGHPICPDHGPGPAEAVAEFLTEHPEFAVDRRCEKFLMTQNPGGYLQRLW